MHEAMRFGDLLLLLHLTQSSPFIRVPCVQQVFVDNDFENWFRKFALFKGSLHMHVRMAVNHV